MTIFEQDKQYIANTYGRQEIAIVEGKNAHCTDSNGKDYIDFTSGIGVNSLGFCSDAWVSAITEQLHTLNHISNLYYTLPQVELAEKLTERTGMKKVFFANSGAEANEGAIKTARKYSSDKYSSSRHEIITLKDSFHGRTITTLAATGQEVFHKDFSPFTKGFVYAKANDIKDLQTKVTENTCAIMLECIQGEGGVLPLEQKFVDDVAKICAEKDILLIVDEVQTGVGRTGTFLCSEQYGIQPDLVTLAKGLGGGLPIGAVLFGEKTAEVLAPGDHATTFGGNPIVAAGSLAVMKTLTPEFLKEVQEKGQFCRELLKTFPGVTGVSGKGLMLGISLEKPLNNREIIATCGEKGLLLLGAKDKLRMLPPLTITKEELELGLMILKEALEEAV